MCNPKEVGSVGVWNEVDLPTIRNLNRADGDPELIDVVVSKRLARAQLLKYIKIQFLTG